MAIQALPAAGAALPKLCTTLLEDPQEIANSHNCKGYLCKIAAVVAAVALVAIFTGAMALYLGMIADLPGWAVAIALISAMGCMKGLEFWGTGNQQFREAAVYQAFADKYNELKGSYGVPEIGQFLIDQHVINELDDLTFTDEEIEALKQKSGEENPLLALLPVIARYQVLDEQTRNLGVRVGENAQKAIENHVNGQDELELQHAFTHLQLSEDLAFKRLNQAILLENLLYPTEEYELKETDRGMALTISGEEGPLGLVKRKDTMIRTLDYIANRIPAFFISEEGTKLSVANMLENHPNAIRQTIFEPEPLDEQEA